MSQIRIANKQDETHIRALTKDALTGICKEIDLDGSDADLKNIEWSYFGHDGVFFVLESDKRVVGMAGAAKLCDDTLVIKRLYVKPDLGLEKGLLDLLDMLLDFAGKMDYRFVECAQIAARFIPAGMLEIKNFKNVGDRIVVNI
ncbi:MAG: GNAT family N-acetyltransferase [Candidatus Melainabacteria bacterium]|nr:GNAT family N-acetyltransferase [Candidatus Melainabacteria bacterium]